MEADATLRRVAELTEGSVRIAAPPSAILSVIADVAAYPEWAEGVRAVEVVAADDAGRPERAAFRVGMAGIEAAYTLRYAYAPDDGGVSWTTESASGAVEDVAGEYRLAADGDGTLVTYVLRVEPSIPLPGYLKRHVERSIVETALEGLRRRVEGSGPGAGADTGTPVG
jgi:ribosome-associated toxin RatA of RatAB toxin-antitoxin module